MQFLNFIFFDRSKCRAHYGMKSSIPMEYGVQKDAKQNFGTCEDPIWAVSYI